MGETQQAPKKNVKLRPQRFIMLVPKRLRQEDYGFKADLGYMETLFQTNKPKNKPSHIFSRQQQKALSQASSPKCLPQGRECSLGELGMQETLVSNSSMTDRQSKTETRGFIEKPLMLNFFAGSVFPGHDRIGQCAKASHGLLEGERGQRGGSVFQRHNHP